TPLTAIESPSASSEASDEATISRTPSPERSTSSMWPRSAISPVNTRAALPLPDPRRDEQVVADPLALEVLGAYCVGDLLGALALERVAGGAPSEDERREEQTDLVDLAGVEERSGEAGAALEQDRADPGGAELVKRRDHAGGLVFAGGHDHVGAVGLQRVGGGARRRTGHDHRQQDLTGVAHQLRVERETPQGIEHDPSRLADHAGDPGGEQRVVGQSGADPDRDRVAFGAPMVGALAAGRARDPLGVPAVGGDLAIERHGGLEEDPRPAGAGALAKRLVQQ